GSGGNRLRGTLTLCQVALSTMLLVGAGLLVRSFANLASLDPGFKFDRLLTMNIGISPARYPDSARLAAYTNQVVARIERLPGVVAASSTTALPSEFPIDFPFTPVGEQAGPRPQSASGSDEIDAWYRAINPHYFTAMTIPLIAGRPFGAEDTASSAPVMIVSESLARFAFSSRPALGQAIVLGTGYLKDPRDLRPRIIVGIVGNTREDGLRSQPTMTMYVPVAQSPEVITQLVLEKIPTRWVVRATANPADMVPAVRQAVLDVDPTQPASDFAPMSDVLSRSIASNRFAMGMLTIFAVIGLSLAAIGLYGLMTYAVVQRKREIGIRISLGASPTHLVRAFVWSGLSLSLVGVAIGLLGSLALGRFLNTLLFGLTATDAATCALVAGTMIVVTAAASYLPARFVAAIDPISTLRDE
ncbi:MAG TPA: FtsX-like permease family protein, partial [Vicinamibacterales bacterium]|nr:FtsX-like permease family protein [Vicinamibacterales bacterium]